MHLSRDGHRFHPQPQWRKTWRSNCQSSLLSCTRCYDPPMASAPAADHTETVSFLLRQVGYHAAALFGDRIATLGLTPPHAGILRAISVEPGRSQQALSAYLGLVPSRLVAYIDDLEQLDYVERRRNPTDRRLHALYLTAGGKGVMRKLATLARQDDNHLSAGLDIDQFGTLYRLLATMAAQQGLTPHVHPGFRALAGTSNAKRPQSTTAAKSAAGAEFMPPFDATALKK